MDSYDVLLEQVRDTISAIQQLTDTAFEQYSTLTDAVAAGEIREQQEIERIMDGLIESLVTMAVSLKFTRSFAAMCITSTLIWLGNT